MAAIFPQFSWGYLEIDEVPKINLYSDFQGKATFKGTGGYLRQEGAQI